MSDDLLSIDVRELLDATIESVEALDALMLLHADPSRWWPVGEIANEISVTVSTARQALAGLCSHGFASTGAGGSLFRVALLAPLSLRAFAALTEACAQNRTAVVEYLSRRSLGRLRVLAEAFTRR